MSDKTIEMVGVDFHFWRDYERRKIGVQREGMHAVYLSPSEAREKANTLENEAPHYAGGGIMREQADMLRRWADELEELDDGR